MSSHDASLGAGSGAEADAEADAEAGAGADAPSRRAFLSSAAAALAVAATRRLTFAQGAGAPAGAPAAAPAGELTRMTLRQASDALRGKRASSLELTEACLRRIDAHQRSLNAFITVTHDQARARARAMDAELRAGKSRGPLHGVPIALKDNV
ncbi:MAG TPA: amidase family protein, partial [Kofleriaceae bacterium]|nr:amidase family protein [Kofleriaceae bacterium]